MHKTIKNVFVLIIALLSMQVFSLEDKVTYYHNDALGSPIAASDEQGNIIWQEAYEPFGVRRLREGDEQNSQWYTGATQDKSTGLVYLQARWYNPQIGRFMSIDPVDTQPGNIHSFGRYAYANNSPYAYVDPDGEFAFSIVIGGVVGLGVEVYNQYQSGNFSGSRLFVSGLTGALGGFGSSFGKGLFYGGVSNALNNIHGQAEDKNSSKFDYHQLGKSAFLGASGGASGFGIGLLGKNIYRPHGIIGKPISKKLIPHHGKEGSAIGAIVGGIHANQ